MRNKMITLDPTAYEYASNMKNFSGWVREMIHLHMEGEDTVTIKNESSAKSVTIQGLLKALRERDDVE